MIAYCDYRINKGLYGEELLMQWFQTNDIGFISVNQSPHTFAKAFAYSVKRPDFLVILPSIGIIAVDAKNHNLRHGGFTIGVEELNKALRYEMVTRMPFWFAFLHQQGDQQIWYWLNALRAREIGIARQNKATLDIFLSININYFTTISSEQDFGKLLTHSSRV